MNDCFDFHNSNYRSYPLSSTPSLSPSLPACLTTNHFPSLPPSLLPSRCKQYILCDKDIHLDGYKTSTRSIRVDTLHSQTFSFSRNSKSASLFTHMNRDKLTHSVDLLTDTHSISSQKYVSEFSHVAMEENIRNKITKNSRNYYDDNED